MVLAQVKENLTKRMIWVWVSETYVYICEDSLKVTHDMQQGPFHLLLCPVKVKVKPATKLREQFVGQVCWEECGTW